MKTTLLRLWKSSFLAVFALFGINDTIVAQYGCIEFNYNYQFHGVVIDKETKTPIQNIEIINKNMQNHNQTMQSDSNGYFRFQQGRMPNEILLEAKDIDGNENGGQYLPISLKQETINKNYQENAFGRYYEIAYLDTIYIEMQKEKIFNPKTERINTKENKLEAIKNEKDSIAEFRANEIDSTNFPLEDEDCILYPNPTNGMLNLYYFNKGKSVQKLQIYNIEGKLMLEESIAEQSFEIRRSFFVDHWAKGTYLLLLLTEEDIITKQFIKN